MLADHAVVVNCIGPYFAFGTTVAEGCPDLPVPRFLEELGKRGIRIQDA